MHLNKRFRNTAPNKTTRGCLHLHGIERWGKCNCLLQM